MSRGVLFATTPRLRRTLDGNATLICRRIHVVPARVARSFGPPGLDQAKRMERAPASKTGGSCGGRFTPAPGRCSMIVMDVVWQPDLFASRNEVAVDADFGRGQRRQ